MNICCRTKLVHDKIITHIDFLEFFLKMWSTLISYYKISVSDKNLLWPTILGLFSVVDYLKFDDWVVWVVSELGRALD